MNVQATNKTDKITPKPNAVKPGNNQEKVIAQLRQEIKDLAKTVKDMQLKQDTQAVIGAIPKELLIKVNAYLSDIASIMGHTVSLSDLTCDVIDLYLDADKENEKLQEERRLAEQERNYNWDVSSV